MNLSIQMDHMEQLKMEKLLIAAGMSSPTSTPSSFPAADLDVALCYEQLNDLEKNRPEDIVMRQALELYCSLMSPPSSPTSKLTPGYQSQQEDLIVTPSLNFYNEKECEASSNVFTPTTSTRDAPKEYHQPFETNSQPDFYHASQAGNNYTSSTVSSVSDQDMSDLDELDEDPFASYPLTSSNRLAAYCHPGYNSRANLTHHSRSSSGASTYHGPSTRSSQSRVLPPFAQHYGNEPRPKISGAVMSKASSADLQHMTHHLTSSQGAQLNLNVQSTPDSKPAGRKRSFSVISFGKHRKVLSAGSAALRILGPIPSPLSNSSSPGTLCTQTQNHRTSGRRRSLIGCLSPAIEENEDITSFKIPASVIARSSTSSAQARSSTSSARARSSTSSSIEQAMNISNKFSSRSESKSIWKAFTS